MLFIKSKTPKGNPIGIYKMIDKVGRIFVPTEYLDILNWGVGYLINVELFDVATLCIKGATEENKDEYTMKLDDLRRLVIPAKFRKMGFSPYTKVEILMYSNNTIYIQRLLK